MSGVSGMSVTRHWQSGDPCTDCGCDAFMDTPAGRLHAHLAECPRLDVNQLADQLRGAVSAIREIAAEIRKIAEYEPEDVDRELQGLADRLDAIGGQ